jgi:hypothetical protein
MKHKLSTLGKLSKAGTKADEVRARNRQTKTHGRLGNVENPVLMQTEAIRFVRPINKMDQVLALCTFGVIFNRAKADVRTI